MTSSQLPVLSTKAATLALTELFAANGRASSQAYSPNLARAADLASSHARTRDVLIDCARRWTDSLGLATSSASLVLNENSLQVSGTKIARNLPIVMTGHQSTLFHPGIIAKYDAIDQFVKNAPDTRALAVIMDTDESEGHLLRFPVQTSQGLALQQLPLADRGRLALASRLKSRHEIDQIFKTARDGLLAAGLQPALASCDRAHALYREYADQPLPLAATAIRRTLRQSNSILELPFSNLCATQEIQGWILHELTRPLELATTYNRVLQEFRLERGVRNSAHPFPSLSTSPSGFELPFWLINRKTGSRHPVFAQLRESRAWLNAPPFLSSQVVDGGLFEGMGVDLLLAPRGAMISYLFRSVLSDAFIHGTGGARYDLFTDRFAQAWLGHSLNPCLCVSESKYLMARPKGELSATQLRELEYHTLQSSLHFTQSEHATLIEIEQRRTQAILELQPLRQQHLPRRHLTNLFRTLLAERRTIVARALQRLDLHTARQHSELERLYECREFPFFLLD